MVRAGTGPRVLFFGTPGAFSLPPLAALSDAGLEVVAVFVPAPRPLLPGAPPIRGVQPVATPVELTLLRPEAEHSVIELAWARRVPVYQVGRLRDPAVLSLARELAPTTICVACFPAILPPELLAIPTSGALNVHPSLLPAFRGPAPIFWVFRQGERRTGVTVHLIDAGLDTGDIVAQEGFELPDGILGTEVNRRCAEIGGRLLVEAVEAMADGRLDRQAQDEDRASYFSWPAAADFELSVTRPARWAFNFMRGADEWQRPFEVVSGNERIPVRAALDWWPDRRLERAWVVQGNEILVQFTPGVLRAVLASTDVESKVVPAYNLS
ncbi:MAG TPA: methionyl-tRNA formyltransferase [Ardenticatenaceae bacterium]|nr:methionyl-tRNA formyltransferase [Ardenticatenaceae bacterium]